MMKTKPVARLLAVFSPFAVLILVAALSASACVTTSRDQPGRTTIRGTVRVVGNEPHSMVGILSDDGKTYAVQPPEKARAIRALQGETVDFTVVPDPSAKNPFFPDGTVTVLVWKIVK